MAPYGSLTPSQERELINTDRPSWYRYVAKAMGEKLVAGGIEAIRHAWPLMSDDYKRAVWKTLSEADREFIRGAVEQMEKAA